MTPRLPEALRDLHVTNQFCRITAVAARRALMLELPLKRWLDELAEHSKALIYT